MLSLRWESCSCSLYIIVVTSHAYTSGVKQLGYRLSSEKLRLTGFRTLINEGCPETARQVHVLLSFQPRWGTLCHHGL